MTVKTIYIARHGYRSNWLPNGPYPPPPTGVDSDVPLAEHGVQQAQELGHYIMSIPDTDKPELLFSSPFYRCVQTLYPTSELLDVDITTERGLGEWFKPDRKVIPTPTTTTAMQKLFPNKKTNIYPEMWETVIPSNKGETEEMIRQRCFDFWPKFIKRVESQYPECEKIMICTHAATKIALGMTLLGFDDLKDSIDDKGSTIRSGACSIDKYELLFDGDASDKFYEKNWIMTMNGNTQFLTDGEEMQWDFRNGFEAGSDADIAFRQKLAKEGKAIDDPSDMSARIDTNNEETSNDVSNDTKSNASEEFETEEVYVTVNLPQTEFKSYNKIETENSTLQTSGLETDEPLIKIGDKVYKGQWNRLVGTEIALDSGNAQENNETDNVNNGSNRGSIDGESTQIENNFEKLTLGKKASGTVVKVIEHELQLEEVKLR